MTRLFARAYAALIALMDDIESRPWSASTLAVFVAGLVAVRNLVEIIVPRNPVFEGLAAFVHYPMAYVAPFLALTLVLALWGGVAPLRVARLMALAWLLTLLPPIADFVLHHEKDKPTIGYLTAHTSELTTIWLRFFDPTLDLKGTTPGIRIETAAAVFLGGLYAFIRGRRWWRAAGAAVTVYVTSLFFFSLPLLATAFYSSVFSPVSRDQFLFGTGIVFRPARETAGDATAVMWLTIVLAGLGLAWTLAQRRHDRTAEAAATNEPAAATPLAGAWPMLVATLWTGALAARWIHLPLNTALVTAPYDTLAFAVAALVLALLATSATRMGTHAAAPWWALLGLAGCAGLSRGAVVGIVAAAGALLPFGLGIVPERGRRAVGTLCLAAAGLGAFGAGYSLVFGPEGLARMPHGLAAFAMFAAAGIGWVAADHGAGGWSSFVVPALAFGIGAVALGDPRVALVAAPAGLVCTLVGWGAAQIARDRGRAFATGLAAALALFGVVRGVLATDFVREPMIMSARCVARLDVIEAEARRDKGDWPAAEGFFQRALSCEPRNVAALRGLGLGMIEHRKAVDRGIGYLEQAVQAAPTSVPDLTNLAAAYLRTSRAAQALELMDRAAALAPRDPAVLANRAQALEDTGRRDAAQRAWQAYLDVAERRIEEKDTVRIARQRLRILQGGPSPALSTTPPPVPESRP